MSEREGQEYGTVDIRPQGVTITADGHQLYQWAHRSGAEWPCSNLEDLDEIRAHFDTNGLVDLTQTPAYDENTGEGEVLGEEFSAWVSDVLRDLLPTDHPCYFICVGQFS